MKNKYVYRSHISEAKTRQVIKCFALDLTATQTAEMVGLNLNAVDKLFSKIRIRIFEKTLDFLIKVCYNTIRVEGARAS